MELSKLQEFIEKGPTFPTEVYLIIITTIINSPYKLENSYHSAIIQSIMLPLPSPLESPIRLIATNLLKVDRAITNTFQEPPYETPSLRLKLFESTTKNRFIQQEPSRSRQPYHNPSIASNLVRGGRLLLAHVPGNSFRGSLPLVFLPSGDSEVFEMNDDCLQEEEDDLIGSRVRGHLVVGNTFGVWHVAVLEVMDTR